ncbi:hypothetical protein RKD31_006570 [Streptomyces sp. SAI-163]
MHHRDGAAFADGGQWDGPDQRGVGAQGLAQFVVAHARHHVEHDPVAAHVHSRQGLAPLFAAHGEGHDLGALHHLLVVGAHVYALVALGQLRGRAGSPRGEEHLRRGAAAVMQTRHDGPADLAHPDDADALHCVLFRCHSGRGRLCNRVTARRPAGQGGVCEQPADPAFAPSANITVATGRAHRPPP